MVGATNNTWRQLWLDHLATSKIDATELRPGKMFVERNDELEIDVSAGKIEMEIRSGPRMVYDVSIQAPKAPQQAWDLFDKNIETNPTLLSEVSNGQLPVEAGLYAQTESIGILPNWTEFSSSCTCPGENRCKHIYALLYFLGEHFDQDPFELMRFLGRSREQFLASITSSTTSVEYQPQLAAEAWRAELPAMPNCPTLLDEETHGLASWPSDPPNPPLFDAEGLRSIGEDARLRANDVLRNGNDSHLHLDESIDLVRRAAETTDITPFVRNSDLSAEQLTAQVKTWKIAGEEGLEAYIHPYSIVEIDEYSEFRQSQAGSWFRFAQQGAILEFDHGPIDASVVTLSN